MRDAEDEVSYIAEKEYFLCNKTVLSNRKPSRSPRSPKKKQEQQMNAAGAFALFSRADTNVIEEI